jgi:pimeloyl-ACP methyl ester carboxylesterase
MRLASENLCLPGSVESKAVKLHARSALTLGVLLLIGGSRVLGQTATHVDTSGHHTWSVRSTPEVTLEVLDWAGNGPTLVMLSGLGNTAHVFDYFAHQFTDQYRVIGITRRGFGASSHPSIGYDLTTRARDIAAVLDHLKLDRVVLVGHSIAGDELTRFAGLYPSRVLALVYLDAAYDRTKVENLPPPPYPEPSPDTYSSVQKFTAYLARVWNWRAPEAETYNTRTVAPDGRVGSMKTSPEIPAEIIKRIEVPDYGRLKAPALALYAKPDMQTVYPYSPDFDASARDRAERIIASAEKYQQGAIEGFLRNADNRKVLVLEGNHYLFITNEAEVARSMRAFLAPVVR